MTIDRMMRRSLRGIFLLGFAVHPIVVQGVAYRATAIEDAPGARAFYATATGLNSHGQVVGWAPPEADGNTLAAFVWDATNGTKTLDSLPVGTISSQVYDINDAGQVIGILDPGGAFLWDPSSGVRLLRDQIGASPGDFSVARAFSSAGHIAGERSSQNGIPQGWVLDPVHGLQIISPPVIQNGSIFAEGVNAAGQVALTTYAPYEGYVWNSADGLRHLGNGAIVKAMNDAGQVVGFNAYSGGAFLWDVANGVRQLPGSVAFDINSSGQIVGTDNVPRTDVGYEDYHELGRRAFLWEDDSIAERVDLNTLLVDSLGEGWRLTIASRINDSGQILCQAVRPAPAPDYLHFRNYLLTPVPEPTGIVIIAGVVGAAVCNRRRFASRVCR